MRRKNVGRKSEKAWDSFRVTSVTISPHSGKEKFVALEDGVIKRLVQGQKLPEYPLSSVSEVNKHFL